jgi:hypothetical protein
MTINTRKYNEKEEILYFTIETKQEIIKIF